MMLFSYRSFSRSISKITNAAEKIGTGEPNKRIELKGPTVIKELTKAFNSMAARLEENLAQQTRLQQNLKELAITDDLTGVYNRRELLRLLYQEFRRAKRFQRPLSIIIFDIDHFKRVNDQYGHLLGDQVLAWSTNLIVSNTRTTNFIARYGGDEFVILLPETNSQNAYYAAERLRKKVSETAFNTLDKNEEPLKITITISLGIAELTEETGSTQDFFAQADQALYKSKHSGRNQTQIAAQPIRTSTYDQN
jgi:diguanylate cyclase (GGDEF)-like protein